MHDEAQAHRFEIWQEIDGRPTLLRVSRAYTSQAAARAAGEAALAPYPRRGTASIQHESGSRPELGPLRRLTLALCGVLYPWRSLAHSVELRRLRQRLPSVHRSWSRASGQLLPETDVEYLARLRAIAGERFGQSDRRG
jgi:hypothetical protein